VNRALFWFHPLAWWLERKLSELAEEACDAAVLARDFDAGNYSECLLDLARSVRRSGGRIGALSATMPGIGLEHRIRTMLSGAITQRVSRARMVCAVGLCAAAVAIFSTGTLVRAQDAAKGRPEFEVASIRPANPNGGAGKSKDGGGGGRGPGIPIAIGHGRFNYSDTLRGLIMQAYHVTACPPRADTCPLISGGPPWINKDFFDIQAKTPEGTPDYTFFQLAQGRAPEIQLMLQALLADRFNLKFHRERKQMPVYALSAAKRGPKLKKKSGKVEKAELRSGLVIEDRGLNFRPVVQPNGDRTIQLSAKNLSMQDVADGLAMFIFTRPVINRTGIEGEFDFTVEYSAEGDQPIEELAGPELFTALQEQAGLKLEATRAVVDVLVIDRAEKPSEN
jgi:bla regulator protein blaR1